MAVDGLIASVGLLAGFTAVTGWRARRLCRAVDSIPVRILVGGGRGKSTLVRLLHAGFTAAGKRTIGRITGDEPGMLLADGSEQHLVRRGLANVRELERDVFAAAGAGAEVLVLENMAVRPELQRFVACGVFRPTHAAFAFNARDHLDHLPVDRAARASELLGAIPARVPIFAPEADGSYRAVARGANLTSCASQAGARREYMRALHGVAREIVTSVLGECPREAEEALREAAISGERLRVYTWKGLRWFDLLSVNDPESTWRWLEEIAAEVGGMGNVSLLYVHRRDRVARLMDFRNLISRDGKTWFAGDPVPAAGFGVGADHLLGHRVEDLDGVAMDARAVACIGNSGGFGKALRAWLTASAEEARW